MKTIYLVTIYFHNGNQTTFAHTNYEKVIKCIEHNTKFTHVWKVTYEQSVLYEE